MAISSIVMSVCVSWTELKLSKTLTLTESSTSFKLPYSLILAIYNRHAACNDIHQDGQQGNYMNNKKEASLIGITAAFIIAIALTGCGKELKGMDGAPGATGAAGTKGDTGTQGPGGANGANGHSAIFTQTYADATICTHSDPDTLGHYGTVLKAGVDLNDNNVMESGEVKAVATICNAKNGTNGSNGTNGTNGHDAITSPFTPVVNIEPCGHSSSNYKEVLLGLSGGSVLGEFTGNASDAASVRNTLIPNGSYYDTDDSQCNFSVVNGPNAGDRVVIWDGSSAHGYPAGHFSAGSAVYTASTQQWVLH